MNDGLTNIVPFPSAYRASGLLLHVTSLPSPYGIGDLGPAAFSWVDRLHDAGQGWWQSLPLGPTGYGNSPYQSLSSFAGNDLMISPGALISDGLLQSRDCECHLAQQEVDYDSVIPFKRRLLETSWRNFRAGERKDLAHEFDEFRVLQQHWLEDYGLFRALKDKYHGVSYLAWPTELVQRKPDALARVRRDLANEIDQVRFSQFLVFRQTAELRKQAQSKNVGLIGDLPFFVSPDSSDVWAHPEFFLLDEHRRPRFVAGVPADYFSAQGQLWGNPVYDWDALRSTGYRWCIDRIRALLAHVDLIRLDHFRGFAAAWHVPAGSTTARTGEWVPGPGADFFESVRKELARLPFIAEDLGVMTPDVPALRDKFHLPGTRVLQFAFDGHANNPHLPQNFVTNTVAYTGTHDNATTRQWYEESDALERRSMWSCLKRTPGAIADVAPALMSLLWSSPAALTIAPLQDLLNLGGGNRMNFPGRAVGNWRWRCQDGMLDGRIFKGLKELTEQSKRSAPG
jgi:4-alpha-glucanotransferase